MTFRQFGNWCNERAADGCWGLKESIVCCAVYSDILKKPWYKRKAEWEKVKHEIMETIVNPTNAKIKEFNQERSGNE